MEVPKKVIRSTVLSVNKHTDPPVNFSSIPGENINRSIEVFFEETRPQLSGSRYLFVLRLRSSISTNNTSIVWLLRSNGRRRTIISYLFHKWLFANLTSEEKIIFLEFPEVLKNNMIFSALKAKTIGFSLKTIRKAMKYTSELLFGEKPPSHKRWVGYRTFSLEISKEVRHAKKRHVTKYTGWRRHQNDQGSMGPPKEDPFFIEPSFENDNIHLFLEIVEKINSGESEIYISPSIKVNLND